MASAPTVSVGFGNTIASAHMDGSLDGWGVADEGTVRQFSDTAQSLIRAVAVADSVVRVLVSRSSDGGLCFPLSPASHSELRASLERLVWAGFNKHQWSAFRVGRVKSKVSGPCVVKARPQH